MFEMLMLADFVSELEAFGQHLLRLGAAVVLGGLVGLERRIHGQWAGMRTHMSVAMGAAIFTIIGMEAAAEFMTVDGVRFVDPTRVVQGVAAGIGFLGAGTILKIQNEMEIKGLTTAASIWLSAALGTACGLKLYSLALASTVVSLLVLAVLRPLDKQWFGDHGS